MPRCALRMREPKTRGVRRGAPSRTVKDSKVNSRGPSERGEATAGAFAMFASLTLIVDAERS